jgi:hypothetical protein
MVSLLLFKNHLCTAKVHCGRVFKRPAGHCCSATPIKVPSICGHIDQLRLQADYQADSGSSTMATVLCITSPTFPRTGRTPPPRPSIDCRPQPMALAPTRPRSRLVHNRVISYRSSLHHYLTVLALVPPRTCTSTSTGPTGSTS